jgi:hypothetical protein
MRRVINAAIAIVGLVVLLVLGVGGASADPLNKTAYVLNCGGTIYNVVSPDHAAAGSDVNSTRQLIVVIGNVPQGLTTFCTATALDTGDTFSGFFLITPAP